MRRLCISYRCQRYNGARTARGASLSLGISGRGSRNGMERRWLCPITKSWISFWFCELRTKGWLLSSHVTSGDSDLASLHFLPNAPGLRPSLHLGTVSHQNVVTRTIHLIRAPPISFLSGLTASRPPGTAKNRGTPSQVVSLARITHGTRTPPESH